MHVGYWAFAFSSGRQKCEYYTLTDCADGLNPTEQDWTIYGDCQNVVDATSTTTSKDNDGQSTKSDGPTKTTTKSSTTTRTTTTSTQITTQSDVPVTSGSTTSRARSTTSTTTRKRSTTGTTTRKRSTSGTTTNTEPFSSSTTTADGIYCQKFAEYRKCSDRFSIEEQDSLENCVDSALQGGFRYFAYSTDKSKCELYAGLDCSTTSVAAANWIVYTFDECIQTTAMPGQGSCVGNCGSVDDQGEYPNPTCHCDTLCTRYHDCCHDYTSLCTGDSSNNNDGSSSGPECPATCYGMTCDEWESDAQVSCLEVEGYDCNCNGCECTMESGSTSGNQTIKVLFPCASCIM